MADGLAARQSKAPPRAWTLTGFLALIFLARIVRSCFQAELFDRQLRA
jgi:rhamnogalacturonyl hydrolase YesR